VFKNGAIMLSLSKPVVQEKETIKHLG